MFSTLRKHMLERQVRSLVKIVIEAVYSEQLDINLLSKSIADKKNAGLLRAYIAIRVAADTKTRLEASIQDVLEDICRAELLLSDPETHQSVLEYNRAKAELSLLKERINGPISKEDLDKELEGLLGQFKEISKKLQE